VPRLWTESQERSREHEVASTRSQARSREHESRARGHEELSVEQRDASESRLDGCGYARIVLVGSRHKQKGGSSE
jgi:hypothetical protein